MSAPMPGSAPGETQVINDLGILAPEEPVSIEGHMKYPQILDPLSQEPVGPMNTITWLFKGIDPNYIDPKNMFIYADFRNLVKNVDYFDYTQYCTINYPIGMYGFIERVETKNNGLTMGTSEEFGFVQGQMLKQNLSPRKVSETVLFGLNRYHKVFAQNLYVYDPNAPVYKGGYFASKKQKVLLPLDSDIQALDILATKDNEIKITQKLAPEQKPLAMFLRGSTGDHYIHDNQTPNEDFDRGCDESLRPPGDPWSWIFHDIKMYIPGILSLPDSSYSPGTVSFMVYSYDVEKREDVGGKTNTISVPNNYRAISHIKTYFVDAEAENITSPGASDIGMSYHGSKLHNNTINPEETGMIVWGSYKIGTRTLPTPTGFGIRNPEDIDENVLIFYSEYCKCIDGEFYGGGQTVPKAIDLYDEWGHPFAKDSFCRVPNSMYFDGAIYQDPDATIDYSRGMLIGMNGAYRKNPLCFWSGCQYRFIEESIHPLVGTFRLKRGTWSMVRVPMPGCEFVMATTVGMFPPKEAHFLQDSVPNNSDTIVIKIERNAAIDPTINMTIYDMQPETTEIITNNIPEAWVVITYHKLITMNGNVTNVYA